MHYASQRDPQLVGLLQRASVAFLIGAPLLAIVSWRIHSELLAMLSAVVLALGIGCLWTLHATSYEITADRLRIRCGPSRMAIPCETVLRITPSTDRRNAPALSFDRLQVDYDQGKRRRSVLISPVNRNQFLEHLCKVAGLEMAQGADEGSYVRRESSLKTDSSQTR